MSRDEIILKIEELKRDLQAWESVLKAFDRSGLRERTGTAMRFYEMRPQAAIKAILHEKGPQPQAVLMAEAERGGITVGRKRGVANVRISIEKTLRNKSLKQVGDLIGLPEWPDEMFKKD